MNDRIDELIALAAFGELSADEQRELDAAAAADPAVAAELAAELETAAALLAARPTAAPPHLRGQVLAAISSTPQDEADVGAREHAGSAGGPTSTPEIASLDVARRRRRGMTSLLAAAAAVVLVVGGSVVLLRDTPGDDSIDAVAEAPDAVERVFDGELGGRLVLFHSASENAVAIEGEDIPDLAPDKAYVLWTITDDAAIPVGQFRPDDGGSVTVRLDGVDPTGTQLGITEEPITGSDVPTLPIKATA